MSLEEQQRQGNGPVSLLKTSRRLDKPPNARAPALKTQDSISPPLHTPGHSYRQRLDDSTLQRMMPVMPIWSPGNELALVAGCAHVWWLDLSGPFGDCPVGVDWTIELPDGPALTAMWRDARPL